MLRTGIHAAEKINCHAQEVTQLKQLNATHRKSRGWNNELPRTGSHADETMNCHAQEVTQLKQLIATHRTSRSWNYELPRTGIHAAKTMNCHAQEVMQMKLWTAKCHNSRSWNNGLPHIDLDVLNHMRGWWLMNGNTTWLDRRCDWSEKWHLRLLQMKLNPVCIKRYSSIYVIQCSLGPTYHDRDENWVHLS
jgi:hypothetical protein